MNRFARNKLYGAAVYALIAATSLPAFANDTAAGAEPEWKPTVSERLIKLPAAVLDKRIDREARESSLGQALRGQEADMATKLQALSDLKAAMEMADGEQLLDLRHQELREKQGYIQAASAKNGLERQQLETKRRLLEQVLTKLGREEGAMTESRRELMEQQAAARERLESSVRMADRLLESNPLAGESRYAEEYEQKRAALEVLRTRIAEHPMNQDPLVDGEALSKPDYVRHLVALTEGEIALLDMEEEMLGYMAKLTSLDAMNLAEEMEDPEMADSDVTTVSGVEAAVDFF